MSELVERLRDMQASAPGIPSCALCGEAADEIERLTALDRQNNADLLDKCKEIERLTTVLKRIATEDCWPTVYKRIAREALQDKDHDTD